MSMLLSSLSSSSSSEAELEPISHSNVTLIAFTTGQFESRLSSLLRTVSSLVLTECGLGLFEAQFIGGILSQNTTILVLDLSKNNFKTQGGQCIVQGLMTNSTLTTLNLSDNDITAVFRKSCAALLATNTTLSSLNLSVNPLKRGSEDILSALHTNSTLKELDLSDCGLTSITVHQISAMLVANTALQTLKLSNNNFGLSEIGKYFQMAIQANKTLLHLIMRGVRLSPKSRQMIIKAAAQSSTLKEVDLDPFTTLERKHPRSEVVMSSSVRVRSKVRRIKVGLNFGTSSRVHRDPFGNDDDPFETGLPRSTYSSWDD